MPLKLYFSIKETGQRFFFLYKVIVSLDITDMVSAYENKQKKNGEFALQANDVVFPPFMSVNALGLTLNFSTHGFISTKPMKTLGASEAEISIVPT